MVATQGAKEAMWKKRLQPEIGRMELVKRKEAKIPIAVLIKTGALAPAQNSVFRDRTKHIDI